MKPCMRNQGPSETRKNPRSGQWKCWEKMGNGSLGHRIPVDGLPAKAPDTSNSPAPSIPQEEMDHEPKTAAGFVSHIPDVGI